LVGAANCLYHHLYHHALRVDWRGDNYRRHLDHGVGFHLNQANPPLPEIEVGQSVWAFTGGMDGRYALAAEQVVFPKDDEPQGL
jgi:hypothetical protein